MKKICDLPCEVGEAWLSKLMLPRAGYDMYLEDYIKRDESVPIGQTFNGQPLFIHRTEEGGYELIVSEKFRRG